MEGRQGSFSVTLNISFECSQRFEIGIQFFDITSCSLDKPRQYKTIISKAKFKTKSETYTKPIYFFASIFRNWFIFNFSYFMISLDKPFMNMRIILAKLAKMPFDTIELRFRGRYLDEQFPMDDHSIRASPSLP